MCCCGCELALAVSQAAAEARTQSVAFNPPALPSTPASVDLDQTFWHGCRQWFARLRAWVGPRAAAIRVGWSGMQ